MPSLTLLNQADYLLPQVVSYLTKGWKEGLLDLSDTVLVLPTQEACRKLQEALTRKAATQGSALLPPVWMLPMQLAEGARSDLAPAPLEQLLWISVIRTMSAEESRRLFPRRSPKLDTQGALELADSIQSLRGELSQAGLNLRYAEENRHEDPRWKALVSVETRYLHRLATTGLRDRIAAQLEGATSPLLPSGIRQVLTIGVPDLPKVYDGMIPLLEARGIRVTILAYDPQQRGESYFDSLGRPARAWMKTPIPLDQERVHVCLDRAEEAEKTALLVRASGGKGTASAVGVSTVELSKPVHDALKTLGIPVFNPAGQTLDTLPIGRLLSHIAQHLREDDFRSALQIFRHPDIQRWLNLDIQACLEALDLLANHLIPSSLDDLLKRWPADNFPRLTNSDNFNWAALNESLQKLNSLISDFGSGFGSAPLLGALRTIYESGNLAMIPGGKESAERIGAWAKGAESLAGKMPSADLLILLLSHLQSGICTGEKKPGSVELPGWLELLWEDAPHLIVAGMNDGLVPETRREDPFLHEKLRAAWGLASDAGRLRRDSYFLLCMMAARSADRGRLDLLLSSQDDEGAALKPSRLLFRCADDDELPLLVQELFRELPPRPGEKWLSAWALKPERKPSSHTLSASALKDYLGCPTRFYLKHVLKLNTQQFGAEEADAATFGTLLHSTLREFGNNPNLKNLREPEQIEASLVRLWKDLFDARYGTNPSFPLLYQREAGIRRLRGAARTQAGLRAEGWEIIACERKFDAFPVSGVGMGMRLRGQIDRIDRRVTNTETEWRIIDYKSSEAEKTPDKQHYRTLGKRDDPSRLAPYECFELNKKQSRWLDMQLPLYRMILLSEIENGHSEYLGIDDISRGSVEAGYFTLPAKISETKYLPLEEIAQLEGSAKACLEGVVGAIHQGIFWPPRQPEHDNFEPLFFDHLEAASNSGQQTLNPVNLQLGETMA